MGASNNPFRAAARSSASGQAQDIGGCGMTTDENPHRIVADAAGDGRSDQVQIEYPSAPHKSIRRLEFAHAYSRRGWHMFPCVPRGKKPLTPNGFKDATTDLSQIEKWWAHWPEANIAIATG